MPIEPIHIVSAVPSIVLGPHSTPHPSPLKMFQYPGFLLNFHKLGSDINF